MNEAYIVYRVLLRLNDRAMEAYYDGRFKDSLDLERMIGKLEYLCYGTYNFETALEAA